MEESLDQLTEEQYSWLLENVGYFRSVAIAGEDCTMLSLKNGNIVLGRTLEEAVTMEMEKTGVEMEIDCTEDEMKAIRGGHQ